MTKLAIQTTFKPIMTLVDRGAIGSIGPCLTLSSQKNTVLLSLPPNYNFKNV